jgi:hypothetical protein
MKDHEPANRRTGELMMGQGPSYGLTDLPTGEPADWRTGKLANWPTGKLAMGQGPSYGTYPF